MAALRSSRASPANPIAETAGIPYFFRVRPQASIDSIAQQAEQARTANFFKKFASIHAHQAPILLAARILDRYQADRPSRVYAAVDN